MSTADSAALARGAGRRSRIAAWSAGGSAGRHSRRCRWPSPSSVVKSVCPTWAGVKVLPGFCMAPGPGSGPGPGPPSYGTPSSHDASSKAPLRAAREKPGKRSETKAAWQGEPWEKPPHRPWQARVIPRPPPMSHIASRAAAAAFFQRSRRCAAPGLRRHEVLGRGLRARRKSTSSDSPWRGSPGSVSGPSRMRPPVSESPSREVGGLLEVPQPDPQRRVGLGPAALVMPQIDRCFRPTGQDLAHAALAPGSLPLGKPCDPHQRPGRIDHHLTVDRVQGLGHQGVRKRPLDLSPSESVLHTDSEGALPAGGQRVGDVDEQLAPQVAAPAARNASSAAPPCVIADHLAERSRIGEGGARPSPRPPWPSRPPFSLPASRAPSRT